MRPAAIALNYVKDIRHDVRQIIGRARASPTLVFAIVRWPGGVKNDRLSHHIQFGSAIAKLDIRHCVNRKYTVARSVCDHLVR